ncbi:hypothetical protein BG000_000988, partial [Podila horticola]
MTTINNAHAVSYASDEDNDYDPYEGYGPEETQETHASGHHAASSDIDLSDYEEEPHRPSSYQANQHHDHDLKQAPPKSPVSTRSSVSFNDTSHQDKHTIAHAHAHASQQSSPYQSRRTSALDHQLPASPTHSFHSHRSSEMQSPTMTTSVPQDSWGHALAPAQETAEISRNSWEENDDEDPYPADAYDYGRESESSDEDDYEERRVSHVSKKSFGEFDPNHEIPVVKETRAGYDSDDYEERRTSHVSKKSFGEFDPNHETRVVKETHAGYDSDDYYESQEKHQSQEKHHEDGQDDYYGNNQKYGQDSPRSSMDSVDKRSSVDVQEARIAKIETATFSQEPFFDVKDEPKNLFESNNRASVASVASAKSFSSNSKHHSFGYEDRPAEEPSASESESESDSGDHKTAIIATAAIATAAAAAVATAVSLGSSSPKPPPVPTKSRPTSVYSAVPISTPGSPVHSRSMAPEHAIEVAHPSAPVDVIRSPLSSPVVPKASPIAPIAAQTVAQTSAPTSAVAPPPAPEAALVVDTISQKSVSSASS